MRFENILIVCVCNICRSPITELLFKQRWPHIKIQSAGVGALVGAQMDATASTVASLYGLDPSQHQARQLTSKLAEQADLILVMEQHHIRAVTQIAPTARGKTLLLGRWLNDMEIPDPYRQSEEAFHHVYKLMADSSQSWSKVLG